MSLALISVRSTCETDEDTREPSESKKADENTSNVSSNLPAVQKEVRKFDGMLGSVRIVMRENKPWFVAKDVAACIEHKDVSTMCRMCRDKDLAVINGKEYSADLAEYSEGRGNPNVCVISESVLYRILAKCSLPKCEPFETWGFDEVLPSMETPIKKSQHETHIIHNQNCYQSPDIGIGSQTFCGVRGYEKEGVAYLHIEDSARGLVSRRHRSKMVRNLRQFDGNELMRFLPI